ncbi:MAG TPA: hypothetical protein G4N96_08735, partial [Chloroflexi bacterium]|nr:hypothetical protein [Chloroflexota bacterium]
MLSKNIRRKTLSILTLVSLILSLIAPAAGASSVLPAAEGGADGAAGASSLTLKNKTAPRSPLDFNPAPLSIPAHPPASEAAALRPMGAQTISTDTTWNTPQNLTQDVVIQSGAILTVTAGADVNIACTDTGNAGIDATRIEIIVQSGELRADGATFQGTGSPAPGCWYGIEYRSGTDGYLRNSTVTDGVVGVTIEDSSPELDTNTIANMKGDDGRAGAPLSGADGTPGQDGIGVSITGTLAAPAIHDNFIAEIAGGNGGSGGSGADGPGPGVPGFPGGAGADAGGAYGILVQNGAVPNVERNTIIALYGGAGGAGGDGGNGVNGPSSTDPLNPNGVPGSAGGAGGDGGDGGEAVGIDIRASSPLVDRNFINEIVLGGNGGNGGLGGDGGIGGAGFDPGGMGVPDTPGGNGGDGGDGGQGGEAGDGGEADGIRTLGDSAPTITRNAASAIFGGAGGTGGAGGAG